MRILLAEDDKSFREGLTTLLTGEGYEIEAVADGDEAVAAFRQRHHDFLLLDVMMPKKNGYLACQEIRACDATVPILFLTAKDGACDELRGLTLGADDYVSKTTASNILLARIAALVRRRQAACKEAVPVGFAFGSWHVNAADGRLEHPDGRRTELSFREVQILRNFKEHPRALFTRDFLLTRFWGVDFDGNDNALSVALSRLREKLGADGRLIVTRERKGYLYAP